MAKDPKPFPLNLQGKTVRVETSNAHVYTGPFSGIEVYQGNTFLIIGVMTYDVYVNLNQIVSIEENKKEF
jgi:hypothetical protein